MERYAAVGAAAAGINKTLIDIFNATATPTRRASIYDVMIGSGSTPADHATKFNFGQLTTLGTEGSGYTPVPLDPNGLASESDAGVAHSAEPTYTGSKTKLAISLNQRATFRWVAAPGSELVCAATQNNGMGLYSVASTGTPTCEATILFAE